MISSSENKDHRKQALPGWIDQALIEKTRSTWEPIYKRELTNSELLEILLSVGRLIEVMQEH